MGSTPLYLSRVVFVVKAGKSLRQTGVSVGALYTGVYKECVHPFILVMFVCGARA
jgi:hypothetical protein